VIDIYPFYHPTNVVFIDDDIHFLSSLTTHLNCDSPVKCFTDIKQAMASINAHSDIKDYKLSSISKRINDANRFEETSVVIIDYQMPVINGMELAQKITNKAIKKVLLTGALNVNDGINAMNTNIISGFVEKNDPDIINKVNNIISVQQHYYFSKIKDHFLMSGTKLPSFIDDPIFKRYFLDLIKSHDIVEYYLTAEPNGIVMFTANRNQYYHLSVGTGQELDEQCKASSNVIIKGKKIYHCYLQHQAPAYKELSKTITDFSMHNNKANNVFKMKSN